MYELSIFAAADEVPSHACLVAQGRTWTFEEVAKRVRWAVVSLRRDGVKSGERVALVASVEVDFIVWLYALFELGCPVLLLHPRLTEVERTVVAHGVRVVGGPLPERALGREHIGLASVPTDRILAIVFTSGSSGVPKGVRLSRRAFVASEAAHAANLAWLPEDRWLLCMTPAHIGGLSIITRTLVARRCVVLSPSPFDPKRISDIVQRDRVTLLSVVPTMLRRLLSVSNPSWSRRNRLRAVLVGGAPFSVELREQSVSHHIPILATYGCTEACSQVTAQTLAQSGKPGSGRPLCGVEVRIRDGEIQIRGNTLMDGYVDPTCDEETWTKDGWLRTNDAGSFLADGQLLVSGRLDEVIITGGEKVAPQEVEACLRSAPGVTEACVFSVPHDEWGQEVVAALVADPTRFSSGRCRQVLTEQIAPYKHPKRFCVIDTLPLLPSGKIDRDELRAKCADRLQLLGIL